MSPAYQDGFFVSKLADPKQAYRDVLDVHKHVTETLDSATELNRAFILREERKRLAGIAWAIKRYWRL